MEIISDGELLQRSLEAEDEGAMGAVSFAVLEMLRRGGMAESEVAALHAQMKRYFMVPSNAECNAILRMVETRLKNEKTASGQWY